MGILREAIKGAQASTNLVGAPSFAQVNPYGLYNHFKADDYASAYPNVRPITNELMQIMPYAIDKNGKPVKSNVVDALFHPNKKDSLPMFMEKLGVSVLALPYTYILVWRNEGGVAKPGGDYGFKGKNIAGFTFLERPALDYRDGKLYYKIGAQEFTEDEVIAIPGGAKPGRLYEGYSPGMASCKWATLDGYIGDFQNGFFENGAIPAGQFVITTSSSQDYKDTKEKLQEAHRGAGNNNNIVYTPRPIDPNTNKPAEAKIEWIPFQQSNKDIDFAPLLEHVDNRMSESYGVSGIIKGVDSNATYNNAEVSEAGFAKRAVKPLALRIYSQITHELNRITGGLGVSITFKYEIPAVSDAEKVKAETKSIEGDIIIKYTSEPYNWSLDSVVDAFNLSPAYKLLKQGTGTAVIDNDKPEVDEGNETGKSPDPNKIDGISPLNEVATRTNLKAKLTDQEKMQNAASELMQSQVSRAISELSEEVVDFEEPTKDELDTFVFSMLAIVETILLANGEEGYSAALLLAAIPADELQGFMLTEGAKDTYQMYIRRVGESYGNDTAESIRKVLLESRDSGFTVRETQAELKKIMDTDEWRVRRLARTELNNSQNIGKLEGVKSLVAEVGGDWEKTIDHSQGNPCPLCRSKEGVWTPIDQPLWGIGEAIYAEGDKGEQIVYINDWQANEANDYHANGKGSLIFRRVI